MNSEKGEGADAAIIPLSDDRLKKVAKALSNETAVTVLEKLLEKSMSATELSESLNFPLTTVEYNINALLEADLIRVERVKFSQKRRDIKYYAPVKRALIFAPEKTEKGVIGFLKKVIPLIIAVALSLPVGLAVQYMVMLFGGEPHELPIDHAYIPFYAFLVGALCALILFLFFDWFIKNVIGEKGKAK